MQRAIFFDQVLAPLVGPSDWRAALDLEPGTDIPSYETGTWTPTVTSGSGTFTTVSATGTYVKLSRVVQFWITIVITDAGTASGILEASLPYTNEAVIRAISGVEGQTTLFALSAWVASGDDLARCLKYDGTGIIASSRQVFLAGAFRTA